jgi:hypothetical protein
MRAFCVLMILTALTSVGDEQAAPVELFFSTPRTEYVIGDPIPVTLLIRAKDTSQVLEYRDDAFRNFYSNLRVMRSDGVIIGNMRIKDGHAYRGQGWVTVATNGSAVKDIDLTEVYSDVTSFQRPCSLTVTGAYSVVSHSEQMAIRAVNVPSNLWVGAVMSAPLIIKILDVDSGSLQNARQVLSEGGADKSQQLRALTKMQYSGARLTADDYDLLRKLLKNPDGLFKINVICVLGVKTSEEGFKIICDVLATEEGPMVRSYAVVALERYNTPEALQLILEECKSRRERSYRAALPVLGKVGDESCIDVLQEIAKTDETDWVRERALESIKKIEARGSKKSTQ